MPPPPVHPVRRRGSERLLGSAWLWSLPRAELFAELSLAIRTACRCFCLCSGSSIADDDLLDGSPTVETSTVETSTVETSTVETSTVGAWTFALFDPFGIVSFSRPSVDRCCDGLIDRSYPMAVRRALPLGPHHRNRTNRNRRLSAVPAVPLSVGSGRAPPVAILRPNSARWAAAGLGTELGYDADSTPVAEPDATLGVFRCVCMCTRACMRVRVWMRVRVGGGWGGGTQVFEGV